MKIIYIFIVLFIVWSLWAYFSSKVENAKYSVIERKKGYEIRLYPEHIVAQTVVTGSYEESINKGFGIIARYIFGGNVKKENISMTAPVVEKEIKSQSIAMTAPVLASIEGESHVIAFGMPRSYTLETLPTPTDSRIKIVTIPEKKMAAISFGWMRNSYLTKAKKKELLDLLNRDNISVVGEPQYAGYNAPWTPPWMTRNEVLVEINN